MCAYVWQFCVNISQHAYISASIRVWSHSMHLCVYIHTRIYILCVCLTCIPVCMCFDSIPYMPPISILYIVYASSVYHYNHVHV